MKLEVIHPESADKPWYADGLNFTCTQCGNCCGGAPGFVWVNRADVVRIAKYLRISPEEMVERYCRKIDGRWSLNEGRGPGSDYDCVFLGEEQSVRRSPGGQQVVVRRRFCKVYEVRPLQCRTWPFWHENLSSRKSWDHAAKRCHGMSHGPRTFTVEQIHAIRDAEQWPENPPTSAPRRAENASAGKLTRGIKPSR